MEIKVNNIEISSWENGYPFWFHIEQYGDTEERRIISFTHRDVYAIRDALSNLIRNYEENLENHKQGQIQRVK